MNPLSAAILTSVADDCNRHWDAGRFGRAPNRHLSPRNVSIVRKRRRIRGCLAIDLRPDHERIIGGRSNALSQIGHTYAAPNSLPSVDAMRPGNVRSNAAAPHRNQRSFVERLTATTPF